jgi:CRP/FNR family cyclic AMP-dependent transcriptional regulator
MVPPAKNAVHSTSRVEYAAQNRHHWGMDDRLTLLAGMPVFGGLNADTLELLTSLAEPVSKAAGEHFFREGENAEAMYVLQTGAVDIYKTWQSTSKLLRGMGAGDCFGEMALIDLFPRSASAQATQPCEALQITPLILHQIYQYNLEQFTLLQMNMGREISRRLRRADDLLFRAFMGDELPETTISTIS